MLIADATDGASVSSNGTAGIAVASPDAGAGSSGAVITLQHSEDACC